MKDIDTNLTSSIDDILSSIPDDEQKENIWEEKPVSPLEFIDGKDYLNDGVKHTIWPWVRQDMEIIFSGENYDPVCNLYVNSSGIGSGKSTMSAALYSYLVYRLLCMRDPFSYFNLRQSTMAFMNMAPRAEQAKGIVFDKFVKTIKEVNWFKDKGFLPDPKIESVLKFPKSINVVPGNSSEKFPLGADLYGGIIDEACFYASALRDPCEEIFYALDERRESRFADRGLIIMISSAGSETCFMESTLTAIEEKRKELGLGKDDIVPYGKLKALARRRPVWECRPKELFYKSGKTFHYSVKRETSNGGTLCYELDIPIELEDRFKEKPEQSLRNLASIPTMTINPYIIEWERVLANYNKNRQDPFPDPNGPISPPEVLRALPDDFRGTPGVAYIAHVDLATGGKGGNGDACGLAFAHGVTKVIGDKPVVTPFLDLSIRFKASPTREIQLPEVFQFILDLQKFRGFKFAKITFDGFQSVQMIQELKNEGINAERDPVSKKDYDTFKDVMYNGKLDYYYDKNLFTEMKYLEDSGPNARPNHAINMHDDESDCVAKVTSSICEGIEEITPVKRRWRGGTTGERQSSPPMGQLGNRTYDPMRPGPWSR